MRISLTWVAPLVSTAWWVGKPPNAVGSGGTAMSNLLLIVIHSVSPTELHQGFDQRSDPEPRGSWRETLKSHMDSTRL